MGETRIKAPSISSGTPARFFPPHRRRPLKSQTYNTLLLIFSQCSDESFASQNLETDLSTDNGSNELQQRTKEQKSQPIELVNSMDPTSSVFEKATELNSSGGDDKSSKDITIGEQMSINQIEQLMGLEEEVEDSSNREEFFSEQMIINELVHIVQGDEGDSPENNPKPFQQIEISGKACQTIPCPDNITINESKNQETVEPISVLLFEHEDRRLPESNASMDVDIGKPTEVVEEGEISFYGNSEDVVSMDFLMQDKKADEEFITDENQLARESESSFFSADKAEKTENSGTVKESVVDPVLEDRNVKKEGNERSNSPVVYDNIWDDIIPAEQEQDVAHCPKRKRGPITKEKRAKRKAKDRKKRAEKNRQLGVRRVKLPPMPIPKPKPLQYCRHFLHGRCQEGDKCKFSHDTVPLTKSKACCHFARHSCMKGDDCPFDHQLSKYPCTNFASNGFCGRGEDCLFSHKTLSEENSSKSTEVEKKLASLIADATSKKQQNNVAGNAEKSRNGSASKQLQSVAATVTHSPSEMSILSVERPKEQHILSQNGNFNAKSGTHFDEPRPGAVLPSPPAVTPKGVSFISIRRSQLDDKSGSGNFNPKAGTHFDQPRSNTGLPNPLNVTPKGVHVISVGRGQPALESSRNTGQSSPAPASYPTPKGINFFSFGNNLTKTPTSQIIPSKLSDSAPKGINILTRGRKTVHNSSDKGKTLTSDRENGKSAVSPAILSPFPISLIQSSSESSTRKDTPPSAHKSLLSALALASKYESRKEDPKEDNLSQVS